MKFTATGNSTLGIINGGVTPNLEYSTDGKNWIEWDYSTLTINDGESIYLRGDNPNGFSLGRYEWSKFVMSGSLACEGNVMSLIGETATEIPCGYCYYDMFSDCTSLTTAPELPATTLAENCYDGMFSCCASLTTAPELPATTLTNYCYNDMFAGCSSLTTAPELPATTLADGCYSSMFAGCSSLTSAPELPATRLVDICYRSMFHWCSKLNNITMLATDISAEGCLSNWVYNVSSTGTFKCASGMSTVIFRGRDGIPDGWTVVEA